MSDLSVLSESMNAQHMTPAEAAEVMGVSDRTIRRWLITCIEGIDYVRTPGGRIRITPARITEWTRTEVAA